MRNGITLTNFCMDAAGLAVSAVCLLLALILRVPERRTRSFFVTFFSVMSLYIVSNLLSLIAEHFGSSVLLTRLSIFFESLFSSVLMPMLLFYLLSCCGEGRRRHPLWLTVLALWAGYGILLIVTQFTTAIYYVSPDNVYHRGPLYPVLLILPVLIMLVTLVGLLRRREKLSRKQFAAFLVYLIVPMAAMLAQMFFYGLFFIVFGTAVSALVMLVFILTDQMDRYSRQQAENARQKANIMVLQMRPHFIYNTLASIYYLIDQDQEKAQQVTRDFMTYLRRNFTAIVQEDTIPFTEELEHTRAYLAVEKARFTDKLFVDFDTPHTRFRVPTLTLQPIVENAVKHGVSPGLEPLHIIVSTRLTDEGSVLTIEDSGAGFVPPRGDKNEPHIALANLTERLQMLCAGSLTIGPGKAGGTRVTVVIPLKQPQAAPETKKD